MPFRGRRQSQQGLVKVYQATGPTDAYLVRDWLERNGVKAQVRGESLMSLRGEIPVGQAWPTLWVAAANRERAKELLKQFEGPTLVHPPWQCAPWSDSLRRTEPPRPDRSWQRTASSGR